jgi:hypothetical protein
MSWANDTAFDLGHLSHPPNQQKLEKEIPKWRRPEEGWSKVNTNAAFSEDGKEGATTSVITDDQGVLQAADALWYDRDLDACTMEALACRDGIKLAVRWSYGECSWNLIAFRLCSYGRGRICNVLSLILL